MKVTVILDLPNGLSFKPSLLEFLHDILYILNGLEACVLALFEI